MTRIRLETFDFRAPDYRDVLQRRGRMLQRIREGGADRLALLLAHYRNNPVDFIHDWGMTSDPRNASAGRPVLIPFIPFPRQADFIDWVVERWKMGEDGLSDKSRDMGLSWVCCAIAAWMVLFHENTVVGFGSRKEEYVDKVGSPKTLFWKIREFIRLLPQEFRQGFVPSNTAHSAHMRINIPGSRSTISGEAGNNIGRGDRASIYFVDESAFLMHPEATDAALSQTTNCRIDLSSVNGMDNPFAQKRFSWPASRIFTFHWRSDPRKDDEWYEKQKAKLSPVIVAQEIDLDYNASKEGIVIPSAWVQAAINLHKVKGFEWMLDGGDMQALDVADKGIDINAFASRKGSVLRFLDGWSGVGSTIFATTRKAINLCESKGWERFRYDADGLGAGVRGDAQEINAQRSTAKLKPINADAFHGSGAVIDPDKQAFKPKSSKDKGRLNKDLYRNRKAQGWWHLRQCFENAHKARIGEPFDRELIVSLDKEAIGSNFTKLIGELSQPTYTINNTGHILVDKAPEGQPSPNYGDAVMIAYAPAKKRTSFF